MFVPTAFVLLLCAALLSAFWVGEGPERQIALIMAIGSILSVMLGHAVARRWHGTELGIFAVDVAALIAIAIVMLSSERFWPIWTTAFQLLTVGAHLWPEIRIRHIAIPFAFEEQIWGWVILVQLVIASLASGRRRKLKAKRLSPA